MVLVAAGIEKYHVQSFAAISHRFGVVEVEISWIFFAG